MSSFKKHTHLLHKTGIFLSVICFIHCISMPILLTALPYLGEHFLSHTAEITIVIFSIAIAASIQTRDFATHKNKLPLLLSALATGLFLLAFLGFNGRHETLLSPMASFTMAISFILNWNLHRKHCSNHSH